MKATPADIKKYLSDLGEIPQRIRAVVKRANKTRLHFKPNERSWSANDILAHIRSCADMWGGSIMEMLSKDNPALPDVHPRQWIKQTDYPKLDFGASFKAYEAQRLELLKKLRPLPFEDWSRGAMIGDRKHTVFSQVRRMAKHETKHCEQIEAMLK